MGDMMPGKHWRLNMVAELNYYLACFAGQKRS